jgi:hypothetical protein
MKTHIFAKCLQVSKDGKDGKDEQFYNFMM